MDPGGDDDDMDQLMSMSTPTGNTPTTADGALGEDDLMFLVNYKLMDDDAAMARGGTPGQSGTEAAAATAAAAAVVASGAPSRGSANSLMGPGGPGMSPAGIPAGFTPSPGFMQMDLGSPMLVSPLGTGAALAGVANAPLPPSLPGQQPFPGAGSQARSGAPSASAAGGEQSGATSRSSKESEKDKRAKRLARNRESARQSRLRKKQHLELLEEKVSQLTTELDELARAHLARAELELRQNMRQLLESWEELANQAENGMEQRLQDAVTALREKFGPDCQERRCVRDFHFDQLQRLLLPPHTKLMLYLIGQGDSFFERQPGDETHQASDSGRIWPTLCHDIGLTPEQEAQLKAALKKERDTPKHVLDTKTLGSAVEFVQRFRKSMFDRAADLQNQMNSMYSVLTPAQSLRYMLWVERNRTRLQSGLGGHQAPAGAMVSKADPVGAAAAMPSRVASGAGGGASVAALIGAARGAASSGDGAPAVQVLNQARLEDVLLQKAPEDLTMADMNVLARSGSNV